MSAAAELIERLASAGVRLWKQDGKLRYRAPAGFMTQELLADLRNSRDELLELLGNDPNIPNTPDQPDYELSHAQRRLWILSSIDQASAAYNVPLHQLIEGDLDPVALERAFNDLILRHESLRTTFDVRNGEPRQIVHPDARGAFEYRDLTEAGFECALHTLRRESLEPFDLARGSLLRAKLMRTGAAQHVLALTLHHLVCDGVSVALLATELGALYRAHASGQPNPLPPLRVQYRDFACWQNRELSGAAAALHRAYWRSKLAPPIPVLNLPLDYTRPREQSFDGDEITLILSEERFAPLAQLAQSTGSSLFVVLQAMVKVLLRRYTGQDDIVVGSPFAGQTHPDLEGQIGFYINMLPLRDTVSGGISFRDFVRQVRTTVAEAFQHQSWPFDLIVSDAGIPRDLSRSPLFDASLILQSQRDEGLALDGLCARSCFEHPGTSKFDLTFCFKEVFGRLVVSIEYATALFTRARIERMASHFEQLAIAAGCAPDTSVDALEILPPPERDFAPRRPSVTGGPPDESTILDALERQARENPDRIAILASDGSPSLTYSDLNQRAESVAALLQSHGTGPEDLVAVMLPRTVDLPVALLGVLKAGAAYIPLDPTMPGERLQLILSDARPRFILQPESMRLADIASGFRRPRIFPHNLAYVIYTSGSTGKPKGVALTHASLENFLRSMRTRPGLSDADVLLAVTTVSFDIAVFELLLPLTCGAHIVLADEDAVIDGKCLLEAIRGHNVNALQATPATWRLLLAAGWSRQTPLRAFCGGEALTRQLAEALLERAGEVWNLYGPTETTVWSAALRIEPGTHTEDPLPVGDPVDTTALYALNRVLRLQPIGVLGQLFIGGDGLARGYFRNPRLTAEKFVPDPFSSRPGARMYTTGDLARLREDGHFSFLGRTDNQIKIRGFRIETAEIEAALACHPSVRESVVATRTNSRGDTLLAAYVMPSLGAATPQPRDLRDFVLTRLPDYMVPQAFVVMREWPLNPNGKIDRKALPSPETELQIAGDSANRPRNAREEILCGLFASMLNKTSVGPEDDFFALGGHSLLALGLVNRIRDVFGSEIPIRTIFEASTPRAVALRIGRPSLPIPPVARTDRPPRIPLSWAQSRLWFLHRIGGPIASYNISVALRIEGALDAPLLEAAINDVVARHESLRTLIDDSPAGEPCQRILPPSEARLTLLHEQSNSAALKARIEELVSKPLSIDKAIPIRAHLLALTPERHVLLLVIHHIAADGWSLAPLAADLATAWSSRRSGAPPDFPPLSVQYADYALWQRQHLAPVHAAQLEFWKSALASLPKEIRLPADRPRSSLPSSRGGKVPIHIAAELHGKLLALARSCHATLFMLLQAAFAALLHRLGAGADLPIGVPIAGRNHSALDNVVGLFVNTLVVRNDLSGDPTFLTLMERVRIAALEAFTNQDIPFDTLVAELRHSRNGAAHPLFQVMIALQNVPQPQMDLPGLSIGLEPFETQTSKFDLTLNLYDSNAEDGSPAGISGDLEFSADLFDRSTAESIARRFVLLLEQIQRDPEVALSRLSLLLPGEKDLLVSARNQTAHSIPSATLVELLEAQAAATPDAAAVAFHDRTVSYAELHARANRLAHRLISLGIGPEILCGISMERSIEALVSLLAVLKAGGVYVPLDPDYPEARLALILQTARPALVICTKSTVSKLPAEGKHLVLDAPETKDALASSSDRGPRLAQLLPANAAYVIYTSGSTGQPKGIQVSHEAVINLSASVRQLIGLRRESRMLQFASFNFDASVLEIFPAWTSGACLVLAGSGDRNPDSLPRLLRDGRVTHLFLTPAVLAGIIPTPDLAIECLMLGGEPCPEEVAARWSAACTSYSVYGPTETTGIVTASGVLLGRDTPIGWPLFNTRLYVLNSRLQPVPPGVEGELYIGGLVLARGYVNDAALTAGRFLPDPFAAEPGSRMYRSGDAVRYRPDGQLEFLRRLDSQVKIRGNRIELHDVESVLESHPDVRHAVVIVVNGPDGKPALAGFAALEENATVDSRQLHQFARERLPEYMVPSSIVLLERLPLGPTGKVDRKALAEIPLGFAARETVAPRDEVERVLAGIFGEVLRRDDIGVTDSFFELGGHSLLATQVTSRIRTVFGIEFPLALFFEGGSVERIAAHLIKGEPSPGRTLKIARAYEKLQSLSPEQKARLLEAKRSAAGSIS